MRTALGALAVGLLLVNLMVLASHRAVPLVDPRVDRLEQQQYFAALRQQFGISDGTDYFFQLFDASGQCVGYCSVADASRWMPLQKAGGQAVAVGFAANMFPGEAPVPLSEIHTGPDWGEREIATAVQSADFRKTAPSRDLGR